MRPLLINPRADLVLPPVRLFAAYAPICLFTFKTTIPRLRISDPPAVIMRPLEGVNVSEGQAANVSCQYNANPPNISEVTWYKDGHVLAVDRRRHDRPLLRHQVALFRIHNVSRDDQGAYSCHVRNAFGTGNSSNAIQLDVFCKYT